MSGQDVPPEVELGPGQRYGWWENHDHGDSRDVALVHGAVNDTGASGSMISLNLARRLKLKFRVLPEPIKVTGLGGAPTYITASSRVKITLGFRVVYVLDVWVTNIGEDMEVLLGMNFMYAAGVRLCVREGHIRLPDEEIVLMCNTTLRQNRGVDIPVTSEQNLYLRPGEHATVEIKYGHSNPQKEVVWAGRGDRWVTSINYAAKAWARSVRVVNISNKAVFIDTRTSVARIVEFGCYPMSGRFVRPGSRKYQEWQTLIYENSPSPEERKRKMELEDLEWARQPLAVKPAEYLWPSKVQVMVDRKKMTFKEIPVQACPRPLRAGFARTQPEVMYDGVVQACTTTEVSTQTDPIDLGQEAMARKTLGVNESDGPVETASETEPEVELVRPESPGQDDPDADNELDDHPGCAMLSTPVKLEQEYVRCMRACQEDLDCESAVYLQEGSELMSQLREELAMLPDLKDLSPECDITKADVGEPGRTTPGEVDKLRGILEYHRQIFLGDGNAAPAPARGVVCDLDVGDAKPVAQRPRSIAPHLWKKVYDLLKKLLETGLIEYSQSAWASPIVIVLKKNGVDIRMCIDYRVVNGFIQLSTYPLPLIDDLLVGFESAMWFMSLDMASGFWAVRMIERAKLISAFICPLGHFQWVRMPFGLKNAPLVYQAVIDNCLWGFVRLSPEEERLVDADVLEFLGLDPSDQVDYFREKSGQEIPALTDEMTVFRRNIPMPSHISSVLGRSSYIDDIAYGAPTWDQLCADLNVLLFRLRYWNISVSLSKSEFGKLAIPYLSHEISAEGIRATPKIAKGVQDLPFPKTLKGVQSFLGSLNYYHKFIEDFPVVAAALYELTDEQVRSGRDLSRAREAFEILKKKIVSTPLLRHPDRMKPFVIIPHANQWAACAVLGQEYDGVIHPVRFTGRVLNDAELRYHIAEKEVVAVMRVLDVCQPLVQGCLIKVFARHSVLSWLLKSKTADGRCVRWGVTLSHWSLEVHKIKRDEDGLPAILGAGITPREHLDEIAENLIPAKGIVKTPPVISIEMLGEDFDGYVLSFDGAAKTSTRQVSCGCILWRLPGWKILSAHGFILEDVTVNDAEYHGLLKGMELVSAQNIRDLVVVGDSPIVIQQVQGLINCNQPNLQRRLSEYQGLRGKFNSVKLVYVKREYNQAADYLTSKTLVMGESWMVEDPEEFRHLEQVSRIREKLMKPETLDEVSEEAPAQETMAEVTPAEILPGPESAPLPIAARVMAAVTRSHARMKMSPWTQ